MTPNEVSQKAIFDIRRNNGLVNFDYWKGYAYAMADLANDERYNYWIPVRDAIKAECEKFRTPLHITK